MTDILLAFVAIYFIAVGSAGNGEKLWQMGLEEMPDFLPWIVVIFALGFLATNNYTEKLGKPLVSLMVLVFILKNYAQIQKGFEAAYNALQKEFASYKSPALPDSSAERTYVAPTAATDYGNVPTEAETQQTLITPMEAK